MSSPKDYAFEVVTSANQSAVTFTVRNKPSYFVKYARLPMACLLQACVAPQVVTLVKTVYKHGIPSKSSFSGLYQDIVSKSAAEILSENLSSALLAVVLVLIFVLLSLDEPSDALMVMEDMGVQISSKSRWRFLNIGRNGKFIPTSEIIDIVIHEGFHGFGQVIYYICVLTRDKDRSSTEKNGVQMIFPHFLPRKEILLQVWKQSRQMLYGKTRRHYRHVPGQGLREVKHLHEE